MNYNPQEGSTAFKVIEFLTTHPDEELTSEDVGAKYDKPAKNVHSLLGAAVLAGALVRGENDDGDIVYRLGTGVAQIPANPSGAPSLRTASPFVGKPPRRIATARLQLDLQAVAIESGIALPVKRGQLGTDWSALFTRMQAGQSCLLPAHSRSALNKACTDYKKAGLGEFSVRMQDEEQLRLWRLK